MLRLLGCALLALCRVGFASERETQESLPAAYFGRMIRSIEYHADRPIDPTRHDPHLGIRAGDVLTRSGVKRAIQSLYESGRYSKIVAHAEPDGDGVRLRFELGLSYYFNTFELEGDVDLRGRALWEVVPLPVGERYSGERLEEARGAVKKYLRDRGYFLAEVDVRVVPDDEKRQVDVVFETRPGTRATIREFEIRGVPPDEIDHIRDRLDLGKGKKYEPDQVRRRLEDLKRHLQDEGFLGASADPVEDFRAADNTVAVTLEIARYERVRVELGGHRISKDRRRRLLPVLSEGDVTEDLIAEGTANLRTYLEERGRPEAAVRVVDERDKDGIRVIRYEIDEGRKVTVASVEFENNTAFSDRELLEVVQVQPTRFLQRSVYSVEKLDADVEALRTFYQSKGYLDASVIPLVEPVSEGKRLRIRFELDEGALARAESVVIAGNKTLGSSALESRIALKPFGPYSPHIVERDRQAILAAYNDAGFLQPKVTYRTSGPDAGHAYRVEFDITEGPRSFVDDIVILGNRHTRGAVIDRRIHFEKNDPISLGTMLETQQDLYSLGVFDLVRVNPQNPESVAPHQDVVVRVQEAKQLTLRYGAGWQERERLRGTLELSHLNVLGFGQRVDFRLRASRIEQSGILSFRQPQIKFLPVNSYFTVSGQERREVSFDARRYNLSYQLGHALNDHSWALLRYNFRKVRVSNLKVSESELEREDVPRNLSTFSAVYLNDTRDNILDPEKGFFTSTDLSVTTRLIGSNNYLSLFTQNNYYRRVPGALLFAGGLRFGAARPFGGDTTIPISERFFAGGGASLRGFETDRAGPLDPVTFQPVGGNALMIVNLELRVPLLRSVHVAGFYDTGNVFRKISDISLADFSHTVGLGVRVKTPFGPLRVDYGVNLNLPSELRALGFNPRRLFVTIGPPF